MPIVFSLGDRVRVNPSYNGYEPCRGATATVVDLSMGPDDVIGLRFDFVDRVFHDCGGACEEDRGYYINAIRIEPLELKPIKGDDDEDCI